MRDTPSRLHTFEYDVWCDKSVLVSVAVKLSTEQRDAQVNASCGLLPWPTKQSTRSRIRSTKYETTPPTPSTRYERREHAITNLNGFMTTKTGEFIREPTQLYVILLMTDWLGVNWCNNRGRSRRLNVPAVNWAANNPSGIRFSYSAKLQNR